MEIEKNYAKSPKWNLGKYLPFVIEEAPVLIDKNEVPPARPDGMFSHFDDEKIVKRMPSGKAGNLGVSKMLFIGAGLFLFLMLFSPSMRNFEPTLKGVVVTLSVALTIGLYALYFQIRARNMSDYDADVIFYRLKGLIQLPGMRTGESLICFDDLKAKNTSFTTPNHHSGPVLAFFRNSASFSFRKFIQTLKNFETDWIKMNWHESPMEYWSFYVWYMDKNRPLPPGSAFDPYRKKDFERRKAEGFPPPLYESKIPTPEYVPEEEKNNGNSILNNPF